MTDLTPEPVVDLDTLADGALAGGPTGEGGLLAQLTKRLVESALEGELTDPRVSRFFVDQVPAAAEASRTVRVSCGVACSGHEL